MRKRLFVLPALIAACCLAAPMFAASDTENDTSPVAVEADRANAARLGEIDKAHQAEIVEALSASAAPRDRALAAVIGSSNIPGASGGSTDKIDAAALSAQAAAAGPNDVLVQWIALLQSERATPPGELAQQALDHLQHLEADNASVWMQALMRATQRHDAVAIDATMQHMATSTYSSEHLYDLQTALVEAFRKYPLPNEYFVTAASITPNAATGMLTRESSPYVASVAIVLAMPFPAYQVLVNACKPRADFQPSAARIDDCRKIGRAMATKGSTLIANRIGFALLRVTRTYTDDDVKLARSQDWILEKSIGLYADTGQSLSAPKLIARMDDQNATGNELEAMRRELVRENIPTDPPANWVDTRSPFSPERLQQDRAAAARVQ